MKQIYTTIYNGMLIQASSKDKLSEAVELETLRDSKTKFLSKKATKEYLDALIEKYGTESEQVRLLIQKLGVLNEVDSLK